MVLVGALHDLHQGGNAATLSLAAFGLAAFSFAQARDIHVGRARVLQCKPNELAAALNARPVKKFIRPDFTPSLPMIKHLTPLRVSGE